MYEGLVIDPDCFFCYAEKVFKYVHHIPQKEKKEEQDPRFQEKKQKYGRKADFKQEKE